MKKFFVLAVFLFSGIVSANDIFSSNAAKSWLNAIDAGQYLESWQQTDPFFKAQLSEKNWEELLKKVRKPLGELVSRVEISAENRTSLPGVPEGEYVVIQFQTEFAQKKSAIEILTLSKSSGQWQPIGYFIQ